MALSADKRRYVRGTPMRGSGTGANSSTFYVGAICMHNGSGRIAVGADTAGCKIAGIVVDALTTGGSNSDKVVFEYGHEEWIARGASITAADLGADAVISDDETVVDAGAGGNDIVVGRIVELETIGGVDGCWVHIGSPAT